MNRSFIGKSARGKTAFLVLTALILLALPAQAQPTFKKIGEFYALSVSADGRAIAGNSSDGAYETVRWTPEDGIASLGMSSVIHLGQGAGTPDISHDGLRISANIANSDTTLVVPGRWTKGQGWEDLIPPVPSGAVNLDGYFGSAWGMSGDGNALCGFYWTPSTDGGSMPFHREAPGGWTALGNQGNGGRANAADYDGDVVVGYTKFTNGMHMPTVWEDGMMTVLTDTVGGSLGCVNSAGTILGGQVWDNETRLTPGHIWVKNGADWDRFRLGVLPGTGVDYGGSMPLGISDDGSIAVGYNKFSMNGIGGFVWTLDHGMMTPQEFFSNFNIPAPSDFVVWEFSDVSPDGNYIIGYGTDSAWGSPIESFIISLKGVAGVPGLGLARDLDLGPAFPNPFNPSTSFALEMLESGNVRVEIFDARGRLVRIVHDGPLAHGRNVLTWDGRDDTGRQAASGLYLARARNNEGATAPRRMMLVK